MEQKSVLTKLKNKLLEDLQSQIGSEHYDHNKTQTEDAIMELEKLYHSLGEKEFRKKMLYSYQAGLLTAKSKKLLNIYSDLLDVMYEKQDLN
jgi:hypothetical protein